MRTDLPEAKNRNALSQGPRTQICKCSQNKKKVIEKETEVKVKFSLVMFLFHESKNNIVLEPRSGHFRGLVGFEAKAKDLSFKVKDFKMCPRGPGRSSRLTDTSDQ